MPEEWLAYDQNNEKRIKHEDHGESFAGALTPGHVVGRVLFECLTSMKAVPRFRLPCSTHHVLVDMEMFD